MHGYISIADNPFTCSERQFAREGMSEKQVNENGIANEESMMPFGEKRREDAEERKTNEELRNHSVHSQSSQDSPSEVVCAPQPDHTHTTALQECEGDTSQNEESDIESEDTREHRSLPPVQVYLTQHCSLVYLLNSYTSLESQDQDKYYQQLVHIIHKLAKKLYCVVSNVVLFL